MIEILEGGLGVAQIAVNLAAVDVSAKLARIEFDGFVKIFERAREITLALPSNASVVPGYRRLRVERDCDVVICDCAIDLAFFHP